MPDADLYGIESSLDMIQENIELLNNRIDDVCENLNSLAGDLSYYMEDQF
ncbi:MAG: hypothetical protein HUJ86_05990, partial [Synergistes sp.]|nr:hypothetical protein [Synergistes sp.]